MYSVNHASYCGMRDVPSCYDTEQEAREYVAKRLRRYRRTYPVTTLEPGKQWEILEPETCALVPDACGVLFLDHVTYECFECGNECETRHDALHCCADNED